MTTTVTGVKGEDRGDFTKKESAELRRRSLRLLGSLVRPLRVQIAVTLVVVVVSVGAQVAGPAIIAYGIDNALPALLKNNWIPLAVSGVVYVIAGVLGALLIAWYTVLSARISQAILIDLRKRIFLQTQKLSLDFHESYTSGRIIARQTSDLETIRELLDSGITELVQGLLYMVFTAIALFALDGISGLILLCSLIPLYLLTMWFQKRSQTLFRQSRVVSAKLIVQFVETMTGIRAVKAFRRQERNAEEFGETVEEYRTVSAKVMGLFGIFDPGLVMIGNITVGAVLLGGGFRVADGQLAVGVLLAVLLYTRRFFDPLEQMATFYNSYQSASAALEKISGVLEETPSVPEPVNPRQFGHAAGHVHLDNVEFSYLQDRPVLPKFTLDIPSGQTIALVGSTGAGKTTLAKLLARFYDPTSGVVTLDGVILREIASEDLRKAVVMVTQEAYLFSGTVADNIALGNPEASQQSIVDAAVAVGAHEFIESLPQGYNTDVNKRGGRVSAGQRQLISFARAFLADPAVLILDEATSSLDIPSERLIQNALQTLLSDRTAVIIAHRLSTVSIADRVLVMEHGRIVEDGTPDELIGAEGRFAHLHDAWLSSLV